jgi:hypothetical protein
VTGTPIATLEGVAAALAAPRWTSLRTTETAFKPQLGIQTELVATMTEKLRLAVSVRGSTSRQLGARMAVHWAWTSMAIITVGKDIKT